MNHDRLLRCAADGTIMHALLLSGPDSVAGLSLARRIAACFLFSQDNPDNLKDCPDYIELAPPYKVDDMRNVITMLSAESFSQKQDVPAQGLSTHGKRVVLLPEAEKLNQSCQNAILKTLEEPPENVLFLLCGQEIAILPTIRSRCATIRLCAESPDDIAAQLSREGTDPSAALNAALLADGVLSRARMYAVEGFPAFLNSALACLERALFSGTPYPLEAELMKMTLFEPLGDGKLAQETANAIQLLLLWQAVCRDAILLKLAGEQAPCVRLYCPAGEKLSSRISIRFTFAEIQCIISALGEGISRVSTNNINPMQTLDSILATLMEKEN